jgi:hypothetical protein
MYNYYIVINGAFMTQKQFIITKKIAKHGSQAILVIPRLLEKELPPHTVVKVTIDVIEEAKRSQDVQQESAQAEAMSRGGA